VGYSLDGKDNVSIAGNATLNGLPNGSHNITVYVSDISGKTGVSETIYFNVDAPDPFPVMPVVASFASVAVIGLGLSFYFKRRKKKLRQCATV